MFRTGYRRSGIHILIDLLVVPETPSLVITDIVDFRTTPEIGDLLHW